MINLQVKNVTLEHMFIKRNYGSCYGENMSKCVWNQGHGYESRCGANCIKVRTHTHTHTANILYKKKTTNYSNVCKNVYKSKMW